jgi:ABC-type transport system involved in multi-copper enzyme maturation permease subunit
MRACFAILKDSFREAAASRVLWLALGIIILVLAAVSPLGLKTVPSTKLRPFELLDAKELMTAIASGRTRDAGPERHIWTLLKDEQKEALDKWVQEEANSGDENDPRRARGQRLRRQDQMLNTINGLLESPELYSAEAWKDVELPEELRAPDSADLSKDERAAKNLRRFKAAFGSFVDVQDEASLALSYGTLTMFGPLRISQSQVGRIVDEIIIGVLSIFLGFFGVFGSLLITAPMIPRTFEPGEISLLLSKPVRRATIFVTKFAGGCAFTLLCATVLVTGIWILLWFRLDLWRPELLYCIPLYVFLFAIYYSVSALAGAVWRNAIVSLILVVVFWVCLMTAGAVNSFMVSIYLPSSQLTDVAIGGDQAFAMDGSRAYLRWDATAADWVPIMEQPNLNAMQAMMRAAQTSARPRLLLNADGTTVYSLQPETPGSGAAVSSLLRGSGDGNYQREVEGTTPEPVFGLFQAKNGDLILPGVRSIYRFTGIEEQTRDVVRSIRGLFGNVIPSASSRSFESLSKGQKVNFRLDAAISFDSSSDAIVAWNNGGVQVWMRNPEGQYIPGPQREIDRSQSAVIAAGSNRVLCGLADGRVLVLDGSTLDTLFEGRLSEGDKPKSVELSSNGSFGVVLTHSGKLMVADGISKTVEHRQPSFSAPVSAIRFDSRNQLVVASRRMIATLDPATMQEVNRKQGRLEWPVQAYDYAISPIYKVLPKPGELDFAVRYLVTGEKTVAIDNDEGRNRNTVTEDLQQTRIAFDPWSSLWSNLGFIAIMLLAGCLYTSRSDF